MFVGFVKLYLKDTCQLRANASRGTSELNHTERTRKREGARERERERERESEESREIFENLRKSSGLDEEKRNGLSTSAEKPRK